MKRGIRYVCPACGSPMRDRSKGWKSVKHRKGCPLKSRRRKKRRSPSRNVNRRRSRVARSKPRSSRGRFARKKRLYSRRRFGMPKLQRMYHHILESQIDRGKSYKTAVRIAAATVNRRRSRLARAGKLKLRRHGGSRRRWYPGRRGRVLWVCLKHGKRFRSKGALLAHFRRHRRYRRR